jgi:hypothetical protein
MSERRLSFGFLLGLVSVEPIRPEQRAEGELGGRFGLTDRRFLADLYCERSLRFARTVEMRRQIPAELLQ